MSEEGEGTGGHGGNTQKVGVAGLISCMTNQDCPPNAICNGGQVCDGT